LGLKDLTEAQVAWLAGIYEGEGSCSIQGTGRAFAVTITMTDGDIINRVFELTGIGSVRTFQRKEYKRCYIWAVSSINAVNFLETILEWLGERRASKAKEAINNWKVNKKQASKNDTMCIRGHSFDPPNKRNKNGTCYTCALGWRAKYRAKKRIEKQECLNQQKLAA